MPRIRLDAAEKKRGSEVMAFLYSLFLCLRINMSGLMTRVRLYLTKILLTLRGLWIDAK